MDLGSAPLPATTADVRDSFTRLPQFSENPPLLCSQHEGRVLETHASNPARTALQLELSQPSASQKGLYASASDCDFLPSASLVAQLVKNLPAMLEPWVRSLDGEDPLDNGKATHSSILAWRIPWTEEPSWLQSKGSQRVGCD